MFRHRKHGSRKFQETVESNDRPVKLPDLRRTIVITDHDFGHIEHTINLFKSNRVDCYRVEVDGKRLPGRLGWSSAIELARKAFVRVGAV